MKNNLNEFNKFIEDNFDKINEWIKEKRAGRQWNVYNSLDIRTSSYKSVHIDSNLFPSGFSKLSKDSLDICKKLFSEYFSNKYNKILLISEYFTRNKAYADNILQLIFILQSAGIEVFPGSFDIKDKTILYNPEGKEVVLYPLFKRESSLFINIDNGEWHPDCILLNNDLTQEIPEVLLNIKQPIVPHAKYGWHNRRKSQHFTAYEDLAKSFGQKFDIDYWLISTYTKKCKNINFKDRKGLDCLVLETNKVLDYLSKKYKLYGINSKPYVFLKADRGTFGMGITQVFQGEELLDLNKKTRHSMNAIKHGVLNNEVIIQEGVPTEKTFNNSAAEEVLYVVNGEIVGEIIRFNERKDQFTSLNSKGMSFFSNGIFSKRSDLYYVKWLTSKLVNIAILNEYDN